MTRSHNRPHTSNDNPFSESHFKTLKYQPRFPQRFGCIEDAKKLLPTVLQLVQPGPPPRRHRPHDPRPGALRPGRCRPRRPPANPRPSRSAKPPSASSTSRPRRPTNQPPPGSTRPRRTAVPEYRALMHQRNRQNAACPSPGCPHAVSPAACVSRRRRLAGLAPTAIRHVTLKEPIGRSSNPYPVSDHTNRDGRLSSRLNAAQPTRLHQA